MISRVIVSLGAVIAMSSVLLVFQLGQPRIFFSMARDGLLPPFLARVHPRFKTPYVSTMITGLFVATFAAFANIDEVVDLTNIGTLFAFVLVSAGVIVLRRMEPDRVRPFRAPWVPFTPMISIVTCLYLMLQLPRLTWIRIIGVLARHDRDHRRERHPGRPERAPRFGSDPRITMTPADTRTNANSVPMLVRSTISARLGTPRHGRRTRR